MGHIIFKTKDGVLIMDRESDISEWPKDTQDYILNDNARQKGVRIVSTKRNGKNFECLVEWTKG
jgi:hypothetical protein